MERATGAIVEDSVLESRVERLRSNIDAIDDAIIALLKERQQYSASIRRFKSRLGKPEVDLNRESEIIARYAELGLLGKTIAHSILVYSKAR